MSTCNVYIDIERDYQDNIIELSAIIVSDFKIQGIFQELIQPGPNCELIHYVRQAKFCHCIPAYILGNHGIEYSLAIQKFHKFIKTIAYDTIHIIGHGLDTTRLELEKQFTFLKYIPDLKYKQCELPNWETRRDKDYHLAAYYMKEFSKILPCNRLRHSMNFIPRQRNSENITHGQMSKKAYGFHCSLIDCFELAFFEQTLPLYCCDSHFIKKTFERD